jgi:3-phytase
MLNHQFKLSALAFAMAALLSACDSKQASSVQDVAATEGAGAQGMTSTATMQQAPALAIKASEYLITEVAGNKFTVAATANALEIRQDEKVISSIAGEFSSVKMHAFDEQSNLLIAANSNTNELHLWQFSPKAAKPLTPIFQTLINSRVIEDLCFYQSPENDQLSVFVIGDRGGADQLLLRQQQQWLKAPLEIRQLGIPYDSKACAVNAATQALYVSEAGQAIWQYQAEPEAEEGRKLIQVKAPFGKLDGDISAMTVLADGSLMVLQEEPAKLLQLSPAGELISSKEINGLDEANSVFASANMAKTEFFITGDANTPVQQLLLTTTPTTQSETKPIQPIQIKPTLETQAVGLRGDVMDDPAIWHHPTVAEQSIILATDKRAGLKAYDMRGELVQQLDVGRLNNVDVRYGMQWRGSKHDVAVASLRDNNSLQLFAIAADGQISDAGTVPTTMRNIYGLCQYHSKKTGEQFVFVNDKSGLIEQYQLISDGQNWQAKLVRSLQVPSQPESCVADDDNGSLYLGEEDEAIWRFAAEPDAATTGEVLVKADGKALVADIEGLALIKHQGRIMMLVSSQGNDSYIIYDTKAPYQQLLHFRVTTNPELGLDGSSETDGLDLTQQSLGAGFSQGALVVQDGRNRMPEHGQNMKLIPLEQILQLLPKTN